MRQVLHESVYFFLIHRLLLVELVLDASVKINGDLVLFDHLVEDVQLLLVVLILIVNALQNAC